MTKTHILLGVDTEADNQWDASAREALPVKNAHQLPRLQEICDRYRVPPTYLVTYEMAKNDSARGVLKELAASGRCEIATHHHPWSTPPLVNGHLYPLNLSPAQFKEQLKVLTEAVSEVSQTAPVSYRAGRNGFTGWQVGILEGLGYLVDSSVDPFFNEKRNGGPSFAGAPLVPYFLSHEDPCVAGESRLLEIPITKRSRSQVATVAREGLCRCHPRLPVPPCVAAVEDHAAHLAATVVLQNRRHASSRAPRARWGGTDGQHHLPLERASGRWKSVQPNEGASQDVLSRARGASFLFERKRRGGLYLPRVS